MFNRKKDEKVEIKKEVQTKNTPVPGDGIRSLKTSNIFRAANFELYVKPNLIVMGLGLTAFCGCLLYIAYMKSVYNGLGYYPAVQPDGTEQFLKKPKSRWE